MAYDWVVVLEVVRRPNASPVDGLVLVRLLELLAQAEPDGAPPVALVADDRYALHLSVSAENIPEAVLTTVFRWENVSARLGLEGWDARRAEVVTRDDFEKEAQAFADRTYFGDRHE